MTTPDWAPPGVDLDVPSPARVYDYLLGGAHNFAADRAFAERVAAVIPTIAGAAQTNRAFVQRAVTFMAGQGIDQFLDLGSGIPTVGHVHEIARALSPGSRVLYVDHDPVAVAHSELILRDVPGTAVLRADLRHPQNVLDSPELAGLLDLTRPVGILLASVLPFVPDHDRPHEAVARLRDAAAAGSFLAITHVVPEGDADGTHQAASLYRGASDSMAVRDREQVAAFFGDWTLAEPGLVRTPRWRPSHPDDVQEAAGAVAVAGVGRKAT
ncbi:SAM-dependent methyltransferase [Kineosporia sp. J2-2]|uniref:SAM-dependent methyltransferase n=1 Tax=Kineosporia corallincola TaxID=2835133 RepID=A0ABS5TMP0_9ACTN|nr:SAM-dependent methyltransferase [Kineosporia corallincola]MBT0771461.1 SAM-dependent methyltransferase [Kineosporia corallincola]